MSLARRQLAVVHDAGEQTGEHQPNRYLGIDPRPPVEGRSSTRSTASCTAAVSAFPAIRRGSRKARKVGALAQLGNNAKLDGASAGLPAPVAIAVALPFLNLDQPLGGKADLTYPLSGTRPLRSSRARC